jgi:hypothetical protein
MISAATVLEAAMVVEGRLREDGEAVLDLWLYKTNAEACPRTPNQPISRGARGGAPARAAIPPA